MPARTQNMRAAAVSVVTFDALACFAVCQIPGHAPEARCSAAFAPNALAQARSRRHQPLDRASRRLLGPDQDQFLARAYDRRIEQLPVTIRELSDCSRTARAVELRAPAPCGSPSGESERLRLATLLLGRFAEARGQMKLRCGLRPPGVMLICGRARQPIRPRSWNPTIRVGWPR